LQQLAHYFEETSIYRKSVSAEDVNLETLKLVLFKWLGIKGGKSAVAPKDTAREIGRLKRSGFPTLKMTHKQVLEWEKAGYPPLSKWLKE